MLAVYNRINCINSNCIEFFQLLMVAFY